ncbi:MAG: Integrase core domain [Deferribacteraceae bacterium]|jgi:hypothetical protein|nr:Integrase core domain [Deferribacteraceae bacterium]
MRILKRVIRTIKEEVFWINEFETIEEANAAMNEFVKFYNNEHCHSSLNYMSPVEYYEKWKNEQKNVLIFGEQYSWKMRIIF